MISNEELLPVFHISLPFPSPWKPLIWFLSLWIYLFWIFHLNGIIQYVTFCVWLLSLSIVLLRFIHILTCISTSFLFSGWIIFHCVNNHYLSIYPLMDIWVVSTFWLSENCSYEHFGTNICLSTCCQLFGV